MTDLLHRSRTTLAVEALTSTIGAVVRGLDLSADHDPETVDAVRAALLEHRVLFFRDQHLTPARQVAVARWFGTATPAHPMAGGLEPDHPEVLVLDSRRYTLGLGRRTERTSYNDRWHTDVTFSATPPAGAVLCADLVPPGGDTLWADSVDAYRSLSEPVRRLIDPLHAWHEAGHAFQFLGADSEGRRDLQALEPVLHPVVRVHPETGERGLFVNSAFVTSIDGLTAAESDALLELLWAQATAPQRTVCWQWREGDVAVWDNRATQHFACADYGDAHRRMRRVTIAGDRPFGPVPPRSHPS